MANQKADVDQVCSEYAAKFQVLADPLRLKMLLLLRDGEKCVCDIMEVLQIKQPLASYHLKMMVDQGILHKRKKGTWNYYEMATDIEAWIQNCCSWITSEDIADGCKCCQTDTNTVTTKV